MIRPLPGTVRQAWGEVAAQDFAAWMEGLMAERTVSRDEWARVDERFDRVENELAELKAQGHQLRQAMEARFEIVEARFEAMDQRFETIDQRFEAMDRHLEAIDRRFQAIDRRFEAMDRRFQAIDRRFDAVHERFDSLQVLLLRQTRWAIGLLALFAAMVTALLAAGQFAP